MMLMPFLYVARKKVPWMKKAGNIKTWLEVHLFCGVVGPVLVTFHTSFKFNGVVAAAYWSMVAVVLSGYVGRYLYVRLPRTLKGVELTRSELDALRLHLNHELSLLDLPKPVIDLIDAVECEVVPAAPDALSTADLFFGEIRVGRRLRALERTLTRAGLPPDARTGIVTLTRERALLLRRLAYLHRTKRLFSLWHVFHLPLVYLLLVIALGHVGVALYLGYVPFRW
jgi:hypothetical protein